MSFSDGMDIKLLLLALLMLGYFAMAGYRARRRLPPKTLAWWLACRLLAVICLLLVLAGAGMVLVPRDTTTVFLVDGSLSVKDRQTAVEKYINDQLSSKTSGDRVAVITFGREPMVDVPAGGQVERVSLAAQPNPNFTDLEKAVAFALDYFPADTNRRLVLITDGRENSGNVGSLAGKLRDNNISLLVYPLPGGRRQDVQFSSLNLPAGVQPGARVPVGVTLDSTWPVRGTIRIFCDGEQVLQKEVAVQPGANNFRFELAPENEGRLNYRGEIDFRGDENAGNNSLTAAVMVEGVPEILVVGGQGETAVVNSLLQSLGMNVTCYDPGTVPGDLEFLSRFKEIFLVNVAYRDLPPGFEDSLEKCVRELGAGLVVTGGERSFAPGGYENTLLEKILPVRCRMKGNQKQPNLGLVLLIDCSGSMEDTDGGVKKLEMAKEAALRSVDVLEPGDYLGVLGFADTLEWVVPFGPAREPNKIKDSIAKLAARGGTLIIPSLGEASGTLRQAPVKVKHIILLTDGQGEKEGYQPYAAALKEQRITLSTVAVGEDADRRELEYLAEHTGGRHYYTRDLQSIPRIFTRETYLASKRYINNEQFTPVQVQETTYFPAVSPPPLKGYVGTGIKDGAELLLKSRRDDPVLAAWRYGVGKVIAWTPDLNGRWSAPWVTWPGFQEQWSRLINWCLRDAGGGELQVELTRRGSEVEVSAATAAPESGQQAEMLVQGPGGRQKEAVLRQVAPGKYGGSFALEEVGGYVATVRLKKQDSIIDSLTRTVHVDYSPEYALNTGDGEEILQSLVDATGGRLIADDLKVFRQPVTENRAVVNLDFILLPLALLFFILDIAARRLNWFKR
ncbi:VWA domain-containing protein [Desulfoscipio sp. XC116]|uniref:VWA domain-containing protein n=1 Tax=Desulfoscipio sp. XC116 TaxID=3144975 RepID=UPI00325AB9B6